MTSGRPARGVGALLLVAALVVSVVATTAAEAGAVNNPAATGSWTAPFIPAGTNPLAIGVHSVLMYNGKVLIFGTANPTKGYVYDPRTGKAVETDPPVNVECAAVIPLADGRILMVGGIATGNVGINNIYLFDPWKLTWTAQPPTPLGRYYPAAVRLADGRVVISGGTTASGAANNTVEVYTPPPAGSNVGSLTRVSDHRETVFPRQWLMPDGNVLEVTTDVAYVLDPRTWVWTQLPSPAERGGGETAWLLPGGAGGSTKVVMAGGTAYTAAAPATALVQSYDYGTPAVAWKTLTSMPEARGHMAGVIQPDGNLLGIGGNSPQDFVGPQYAALGYNVAAGTWTTLAPQALRRGYHSSAVLLPDGRVLSAGDTGAGGGNNQLEIFSPPYLFKGGRPTISAGPLHITHGKTFTIFTPDTTSRVILMAPGASTHTDDMDTRSIELTRTAGTGVITALTPGNANVAPKGWYMLWLVNPTTGVPSAASWVHVD